MRPSAARTETSLKGAAEVLDAAARVFARQGYEGTSIDDIADELRSTKGRVYHYFRTKSDLLLGVQTTGARQLVEGARAIVDDSSLSPKDRLFRMARTHAATMMSNHAYQFVSLRFLQNKTAPKSGRADADWAAVLELRREYEDIFTEVLREGAASGAFSVKDERLTMRGILGALNWITVWFDPDAPPTEDRRSPDQIASSMAEFLVAGAVGGDHRCHETGSGEDARRRS